MRRTTPAIVRNGFASRQTKDVVITAIVSPSNDIAHGYDGSEITLGETPVVYELHGSEHALLNVFCGNSVLGQDLLDGKVQAVGKLAHLAELTGRSLAWVLGGA